jgi:Tfp pilus assembly protein PilF
LALSAIALALLACAPYVGRLSGPFLFDDQDAIENNASIRTLELTRVLAPPRETPVAGRPLVNLSFALDYALFGPSPAGFHLVNLALHALCVVLAFFGLRRLLLRGDVPPALERHANSIAFGAALLFAVHPVASEVVLYATQRSEVLVSVWYLAALYVTLGEMSAPAGPKPHGWLPVALLAILGGASKEVFATAPLIALLCDRAFFAGSFAGALRARARLYLALASSWLVLLASQWSDPRPDSVRFGDLDYLLAQTKVIPGYLVTAVWPAHPALDYGPLWPQSALALAPFIALTVALLVAAGALTLRRPRLGFLGAWFFVILAPSSSVFGIQTEVAAERRLYLPLIGLCAYAMVALTLAAAALARSSGPDRASPATLVGRVAFALALALATVTRAHTASYSTVLDAWQAAVDARPDNARAHYNLAETYRRAGDTSRAIASLRAALALREAYADAQTNLGALLITQGELLVGTQHVTRGAALAPQNPIAHYNLGVARALSGDHAGAVASFEATLRLQPSHADARRNLGRLRVHPPRQAQVDAR